MVVVVLQDPGEAEHKFIDKIREMTKPEHGTSASSSSGSGSAGDGAPPVSGNQSVVVWSPDSDVLLLLLGCYHTSGAWDALSLEANLCFLHERRAPGPGRRTAHPLVASSCDARVSVQSRNSCPSWPTSVRCTSC